MTRCWSRARSPGRGGNNKGGRCDQDGCVLASPCWLTRLAWLARQRQRTSLLLCASRPRTRGELGHAGGSHRRTWSGIWAYVWNRYLRQLVRPLPPVGVLHSVHARSPLCPRRSCSCCRCRRSSVSGRSPRACRPPMGGCHSASSPAGGVGDDRSTEIEAALKAERERTGQCIKLLLLGSGECGQSTRDTATGRRAGRLPGRRACGGKKRGSVWHWERESIPRLAQPHG